MKNSIKYKFALLLLITVIPGCYGIHHKFERIEPQYTLIPRTMHGLPAEEGNSRVVIFNNSNVLLYGPDLTDKIDILIDNKPLGSIRMHEYIMFDLMLGTHNLDLTHYDLFKFSNSYNLEINDNKMYIEVYNGLISTKFKLVHELPERFHEKYQ